MNQDVLELSLPPQRCHVVTLSKKSTSPAVQNFDSFKLSISPHFVNYILTSKRKTLLFFVEKM